MRIDFLKINKVWQYGNLSLIELWSCRGKISMQENSMGYRPDPIKFRIRVQNVSPKMTEPTDVGHWGLWLVSDMTICFVSQWKTACGSQSPKEKINMSYFLAFYYYVWLSLQHSALRTPWLLAFLITEVCLCSPRTNKLCTSRKTASYDWSLIQVTAASWSPNLTQWPSGNADTISCFQSLLLHVI